MRKAFKMLWNDKRGNALIVFGAALPLLVGAAGLAADTIQWTLWKRQLQRAADSGAIAGVYTRIKTDTQEAVVATVNTDLTLNQDTGIALASGYPVVERPADDGDKKKQVKVTLEISQALPFSSMFLNAAPKIRAVATAATVPGAEEYCVIALDPSVAATGLELSGSTDVDIGDCSMMANSKHPSQAASNGASSANGGKGSTVKAKSIAAAGGVQYSKTWNVTDYDPNSPAIADPHAGVPAPTSSQCTKTISGYDKNKAYPEDRRSTDSPGDVVCINGDVTVQDNWQLATGVTYVLNGGDLTMNSTSSSLSCTNCTIAMTDFTNPANTGSIKLTGGNLSITAPTTGTYKGIAFYQDRGATDDGSKSQNHINGNSNGSVTGVVYIPNQSVLYNGGGGLTAACLQLIGKRVEFGGSSMIKVASKCPGTGMTPIGGGTRVRLVA
jgi:Flp pilus assembly protein TadG